MRDFRTFQGVVARLGAGRLPERRLVGHPPGGVLKALSLSRNLGHDVRNFTTADLDMIRHYRPGENVLKRPVLAGGASYAITGHHEILVPLLAQALLLGLETARDPARVSGPRRRRVERHGRRRGDLMLDETWTGDVSRVAPEAPVPLLNLASMSRAPARRNVVENLVALGAKPIALGAVGRARRAAWLARRLTTLPGGRGRSWSTRGGRRP